MVRLEDHKKFEQCYLAIRKIEGRLLPDDIVSQLPYVSGTHPLAKEWKIRAESCKRLCRYLASKRKPLQVIEIGCGNGWLCNQLSAITQATVTGIDINQEELKQAARVFSHIQFVYGDLMEMNTEKRFDVIVFAASLQYFPSIKEILEHCLTLLKADGEIHILDTHFYSDHDLFEARQRTTNYFIEKGLAARNAFYFHHSILELANYHHWLRYNPRSIISRMFYKNPFPWIVIKH